MPKLDSGAPDGFVTHSFAGDDPIACRDHVRAKAGLEPFKPNGKGHRASDNAIERALMGAVAKQSSETPKGRVVAKYDYTNQDGTLLYQVLRLEPKSFRQRRPNGNGWIWQLDERRVIYRWPELLKYPDATVFVCEGEKDADRVASLGHCATAVAGGRWTKECVQALTGHEALLGEWDAGDDTEMPPPRAWLLGNVFARRFVSSLFAEGGTGKTSVRYAQFLALATGKPLTGEHVFQRCRVLIVSLEDDADELRRRIRAAMLHHNIERAEAKGWLFLAAPGARVGKLMTLDAKGRTRRGILAEILETVIVERKIDLISLDPFVKAHAVDENLNKQIDEVVEVLTGLATKYDIAVDVPHHTRKGSADPGNADRGHGASAMKDAGRLIYTLTTMTADEAQALSIEEDQRRLLARMDSAKVNIAPPMAKAKWFRIVGIPLGNATDLYPNGDIVQTVEPWTPPDLWKDLSIEMLNRILSAIDAGLPDGNRYTDAAKAGKREAWRVIVEHTPEKSEAQAREVIKIWVRNGVLKRDPYENPVTRKEVNGLRVNPEKRPT